MDQAALSPLSRQFRPACSDGNFVLPAATAAEPGPSAVRPVTDGPVPSVRTRSVKLEGLVKCLSLGNGQASAAQRCRAFRLVVRLRRSVGARCACQVQGTWQGTAATASNAAWPGRPAVERIHRRAGHLLCAVTVGRAMASPAEGWYHMDVGHPWGTWTWPTGRNLGAGDCRGEAVVTSGPGRGSVLVLIALRPGSRQLFRGKRPRYGSGVIPTPMGARPAQVNWYSKEIPQQVRMLVDAAGSTARKYRNRRGSKGTRTHAAGL